MGVLHTTGSGCGNGEPLTSLLLHWDALGDLLLKPSDEASRDRRLVAAGAECIGPLPVREPRQQLARPMHVAGVMRRRTSS